MYQKELLIYDPGTAYLKDGAARGKSIGGLPDRQTIELSNICLLAHAKTHATTICL
jgi:hypothetical protein